MSVTITPAVVGSAYLTTREEIAGLEKQIKDLKELQSNRENWLGQQLANSEQQSSKTAGDKPVTYFFVKKESVKVADRNLFFDWVIANNATEFLNSVANKSAALDMMGEDRNKALPPGLEYTSIRAVNVRKG